MYYVIAVVYMQLNWLGVVMLQYQNTLLFWVSL